MVREHTFEQRNASEGGRSWISMRLTKMKLAISRNSNVIATLALLPRDKHYWVVCITVNCKQRRK